MFYHARFYDPALGTFISPDTMVPEPGAVADYNRFAYTRSNPLKYMDADGHSAACSSAMGIPGVGVIAALLCQAGEAAVAYGPTLVQQAALWADKVPAVVDMLFNNPNSSQQAQQASSNAGNTAGPGGLDPNKLPHGFPSQEEFSRFGAQLQSGLQQAGYDDVQAAFQGSSVTGQKYTTGEMFDVGRVSDYDIALGSQKLFSRAQELGISLRGGGIRTGPLGGAELEKLGLTDLAEQLTNLAGRPVNFMIYQTIEAAAERSPSIIVP